MDCVLDNPFRVLGLPVTATAREIAKRASDLEIFAEMGKDKIYPQDYQVLGAIDRSIDAVKDAVRRIEKTQDRLFHSLFWFRSVDAVDATALDSFQGGSLGQAIQLLDKKISATSQPKYSWRLNRSTLTLAKLAIGTVEPVLFRRLYADIGTVLSDHADDLLEEAAVDREGAFELNQIFEKVVVDLLGVARQYYDKADNQLEWISLFAEFPRASKKYVQLKIVNPIIQQLQDAIEHSEQLRAQKDLGALRDFNQLKQVEGMLEQLHAILGDEDLSFKAIANAYVDEICDCSLLAHNHFDETALAVKLIQWASQLPSYGSIQQNIVEKKQQLEEILRDQAESESYTPIFEELKKPIYNVNQASDRLFNLQRQLQIIKNKQGRGGQYTEMSSICVGHILNFLIEDVNQAQEHVANRQANRVTEFKQLLDTALRLINQLHDFDMDDERRAHLKKNHQALLGLKQQVDQATQSNSSSISDFKISGWVWIIGIIILLAMCSN